MVSKSLLLLISLSFAFSQERVDNNHLNMESKSIENTNNNLKEQLNSIDLHENKRLLAMHPELVDTSAHLTRLGAWKSEAIHEEKMLQKYQALAGMENAECVTCGQDIDQLFVETSIKEHTERMEQCEKFAQKDREKLQEAEEHNEIHRTATKNIEDWESIYRSIDNKLPSQVINGEELGDKIQTLRERIATARESLSKVVEENERRERHNTRIGIIQEQTEQFQEQLSSHELRLESAENKLTILEILKKAFSTNGLLAYKIESLVKELEILTNEYLAEFSDGRFSINFVVENDKLNVEVSDNGNIIDILALSSGELARVNIATLVAIRKLMTSISRSQINVLFLDEVNQALDEQGKEKVVEVLLKEENLNTYLVSHGWTHPLLEKIEIIKEDNISCLSS